MKDKPDDTARVYAELVKHVVDKLSPPPPPWVRLIDALRRLVVNIIVALKGPGRGGGRRQTEGRDNHEGEDKGS